jgi:hypothetical protein
MGGAAAVAFCMYVYDEIYIFFPGSPLFTQFSMREWQGLVHLSIVLL